MWKIWVEKSKNHIEMCNQMILKVSFVNKIFKFTEISEIQLRSQQGRITLLIDYLNHGFTCRSSYSLISSLLVFYHCLMSNETRKEKWLISPKRLIQPTAQSFVSLEPWKEERSQKIEFLSEPESCEKCNRKRDAAGQTAHRENWQRIRRNLKSVSSSLLPGTINQRAHTSGSLLLTHSTFWGRCVLPW